VYDSSNRLCLTFTGETFKFSHPARQDRATPKIPASRVSTPSFIFQRFSQFGLVIGNEAYRIDKVSLLAINCVLRVLRSNSLPLLQIQLRIGSAQETLNRMAVSGIDGNTYADRNVGSVVVLGNMLANTL
jgi:hypothetical protein